LSGAAGNNDGATARIVCLSCPGNAQERIHPATRTFQALRIVVNRELDEIKDWGPPELLKPSGRLVVIQLHSLEDRIAKDSLREGAHKESGRF